MSASPALFVKNPGKDFARERKLPFGKIIELLLSMGGNCLYKELLEANSYDLQTATTSAFIQQREKILPFAFEFLLHEFTQSFTEIRKYRGYRLLAIDGSDLHIATDPKQTDSFIQNRPDEKGYNLLHLNAVYDLCNRLYLDALVQPHKCKNESKALVQMVDRSRLTDKTIIIADRGFESYNNFAHIERKGWNYIIRVKDLGSNGILAGLGLTLPPDETFDVCEHRILTKKQTNEVKARPEQFRIISAHSTFDFLGLHTNKFYPISVRLVRVKISDNSYETLITNLDPIEFPAEELKALYKMRWGIETSFRELKYTVGLTNFHAKKQEYIIQEIFARMTMYNFAEMITLHVVISKMDNKHSYQVNFSIAIYICRHFLRCPNNAPPPDVETLICKNSLPIRPDRKAIRKISFRATVSFIYRVA